MYKSPHQHLTRKIGLTIGIYLLLVIVFMLILMTTGEHQAENQIASIALVKGSPVDQPNSVDSESYTLNLDAQGNGLVQFPMPGIKASELDLVTLVTSLSNPSINMTLVWRTFDDRSGSALLSQPVLGSTVHILSNHPEWNGLIKSVGLEFSASPDLSFVETANQQITISYFSIDKSTALTRARAFMSTWLDTDTPTMRTPHHTTYVASEIYAPPFIFGMVLALVIVFWLIRVPIKYFIGVMLATVLLFIFVQVLSELLNVRAYQKNNLDYVTGSQNDADKKLNRIGRWVKLKLEQQAHPLQSKILVKADTEYLLKRLIYHLLPLNSGELLVNNFQDLESFKGNVYVVWQLNSQLDCAEIALQATTSVVVNWQDKQNGFCLGLIQP